MKTKIFLMLTALFCSASLTRAQLVEYSIGTPNPDEITNCQVYDNTSAAGAALVHVGYDNTGNALITKTSPDGSVIYWQQAIPGSASNPNLFYQVIIASHTPASPVLSNGDYIVVGQTGGSIFVGNQGIVCRYSTTGTLLASQIVSDPGWGISLTGVCELTTGNITAVGYENQGGTQNAIIETFTAGLGPVWYKSLSNTLAGSPKSIFLSVICDGLTIYAIGNTDNMAHTGYDGTVTRFTYAGAVINAQLYDVSYSYLQPFNYTLNSMWFLKPVLLPNNHLYIWTSLSNWIIVADDAAVVDIDNTTFVPVYTSIHSPANVYINGQGVTDFDALGPNDYVFTIAPGSSQFDESAPNNPPFPPAVVRLTGGVVAYAHQINDPTRDYGLFASYADAANVFAGGFNDMAPGGQKDLFTLEAAGGNFTGNCPLVDIPLDIQNQNATWTTLPWKVTKLSPARQSFQSIAVQMPNQLICQGQGPCTMPCPSMLTLTVVDHDGLPYGTAPCTFDGTVVVSDSNSCWMAYSYQWSLYGTTVTNYSSYFTNTQTLPIPIGFTSNMQVIITFVDGVGDTCRDTLVHNGLWCNGGHAGGRMVQGNGSTPSAASSGVINIFPNPTTGTVNITTPDGVLNDVEVIDVNGKCVAKYSYDNVPRATVSLEKLPAGLYMIKVNGSTTKVVSKIE